MAGRISNDHSQKSPFSTRQNELREEYARSQKTFGNMNITRTIQLLAILFIIILLINIFLLFLPSLLKMNNSWPYTAVIVGVIGLQLLALIGLAVFYAFLRKHNIDVIKANHEIETDQSNLAKIVSERTKEYQLIGDVVSQIARERSLDALTQKTVETIRSSFDLYFVGLYLTDPARSSLVLRAASSNKNSDTITQTSRILIDMGSLIGTIAVEKKIQVIPDTALNNQYKINLLHPNTRSEMIIPLLTEERLIGVLDLHADRVNGLNHQQISFYETLSVQLAAIIEIAKYLEETYNARMEAERQSQRLTKSGWQEFLNAIDQNERTGYSFDQGRLYRTSSPIITGDDPHIITVPISASGEQIGSIQLEHRPGQLWGHDETQIVKTVSDLVARQVENLRLLAQAERYRVEAEAATRSLTHRGWESFLSSQDKPFIGYEYDQNQIIPYDFDDIRDTKAAISYPLQVRGQIIGELSLFGDPINKEIIKVVSERLSEHLENIRLFEQTQRTLSVTENLYMGSERIIHAKSVDEVLKAVIETTPLNKFERGIVALFNHPWQPGLQNFITIFGTWERDGEEKPILNGDSYSVGDRPFDSLYHDKKPLLVNEIDSKDLIDDQTRILFQHLGNNLAIFPLLSGEQWFGWLATGASEPILLNNYQLRQIESLVNQAAAVIQRKQVENDLAQRAKEMEIVSRVSTATTAELDPDRLLQSVVDLTKENFNFYHTQIYLLDRPQNTLILAAGAGEIGQKMISQGWKIPLDTEQSIVSRAAATNHGVIVNDVSISSDYLPNPYLPDTKSELAVPMVIGDKVIGILDVQSERIDRFTNEDITIQATLAAQIAVALQNARQYEQTQRRTQELAILNEMGRAFASTLDINSIFELAYKYASRLVDTTNFTFAMYNSDSEELSFPLMVRDNETYQGKTDPISSGLITHVVQIGESLLISDNLPDRLVTLGIQSPVADNNEPVLSWLGAPIMYGKEVIGVIAVQSNKTPGLYTEVDKDLLSSIASQAAIAIENARIFKQIQHQAELEATINVISQKIQSTTTIENALQIAVRELGRALGSKRTSVQLNLPKRINEIEPENK